MQRQIEKMKEKILPILPRYGVTKAGLFGSYAQEKAGKDSDIDLLIEIEKDISLLDFVGLKLDIEQILGKKVDLVEYKTIKPLLRERILNEEIRIL